MKLTDFLQDVGRPVAYFPELKRITGSTTATILLCQFIYWRGKEADQDGWLYKTSEEIEDETGLTYNEQKTARKALTEAGLLQEHYARLDHQLRFKIDLDKINESWGNAEPKNGECDDSTFGKDESPFSLNSNTEITSETTMGADAPLKTDELPLEWQIAGEVEKITPFDERQARRLDFANLVATGMAGSDRARAIVFAFQDARDITLPESKVKGQRKAVREMIEMGVTAEHVRAAVRQLTEKGMTVADLYSVSKTAIDLANKPQETRPEYKPIPERVGVPRPAHIPPPNIKRSKDDSANS